MKNTYIFIFLLILPFLFFFCSNSFDSETDLGKNLFNQIDSTLVVFDGKIIKDSLPVTKISSFVDKTESARSGLIGSADFAIGRWNDEVSIMYMEFLADSLDSILSRNSGTSSKLHSFALSIDIDTEKSSSYGSKHLEIGYCVKKSPNEYLDTSRLVPISWILLKDTVRAVKIPISNKFLLDTAVILDTATSRIEYILDTTYTYLYRNDSIINTVSSQKYDSCLYDSVSAVSSIVHDDSLLYDTTIQSVSQDTTFISDTIKTVKKTVHLRIDKILQHIIINQDTTVTTFYDTTHYTKSIVRKTIVQKAKIYPNMTINTHVSDSKQLGSNGDTTTMRYMSFYARLRGESNSSLLFLHKPNLNFVYINSENDTILDTVNYHLHPLYNDYSIFELNTSLNYTSPMTSGAAGRFIVFEINMISFWDRIKDNTGNIFFKNIPKAELTVYPELLKIHKSVSYDNTTPFQFCFLHFYTENIEEIPSYRISTSIDSTTTNVVIPLENYFLNILKDSPLSPKGYLYIWTKKSYFSQITWKKADTFPVEYVVLNSH